MQHPVPRLHTQELALRALGYVPITFMELYCVRCGGFRGAAPLPLPQLPCPQCSVLRDAAIIAEGFSRHPDQIAWQRWEAPLSLVSRAMLLSEADEAASIRRHEKSGNGRSRHYATEKAQQDCLRQLAGD